MSREVRKAENKEASTIAGKARAATRRNLAFLVPAKKSLESSPEKADLAAAIVMNKNQKVLFPI